MHQSSETGPDKGGLSPQEVASARAAREDAYYYRLAIINNKRIREGLEPLTMEEFAKPKEKEPMKISGKGESKYLSKEDIDHPEDATIDRVTVEVIKGDRGEEKKHILHFSERHLKPMTLNVTNKKRIIAAFGDETDDWKGKVIEVYVDPNVEMGGEVVGGLRVRIPSNDKFAPPKPSNNGHWTLDQCVAECSKAGITREEMVAALKARGNGGYHAPRDTPFVQQMIAATKVSKPAEESFDTGEIPF